MRTQNSKLKTQNKGIAFGNASPATNKKRDAEQRVEWHILDAKGAVLGRIATRVASLLLGKHRTDCMPNMVAPVYVIVTNTDKVNVTGNKKTQKLYRHYTGYPGGLRERSLEEQMKKDSRKIIHNAVAGMLPKNNLRDQRMRQLKLYHGADHPHKAQLSENEF